MEDLAQSLYRAAQLLLAADSQLWSVVALSLRVSGTACLIGAALGLAAGAWLAMARFPGHAAVVGVLNTLLALPSVVVGLIVYLLLSRAGPLGPLGILFTPTAMVIAQSILVVPLVAALARRLVLLAVADGGDQLRSLGAGPFTTAAWPGKRAIASQAPAARPKAAPIRQAVPLTRSDRATTDHNWESAPSSRWAARYRLCARSSIARRIVATAPGGGDMSRLA